MKRLAMSATLALLFRGLSVSSAAAQEWIEGSWVGGFELGKELTYLQVGFAQQDEVMKLNVLSMLPAQPSGLVAPSALRRRVPHPIRTAPAIAHCTYHWDI